MLDAVIFDLGGVLMLPPAEGRLTALGELCGLEQEAFAAAWLAPRHAYDRGELTGAEYWRLVGVEDEAVLAEVLEADAAAWSTPNLALAEWLPVLRSAGLRTGVLSNMPREQWQRLAPVYEPWLDGCAELTLSFETGTAKPDERIYRHCLDRLGVEPERALFLDDVEENVEAARGLGMHAVLYTGFAAVREELAAGWHGILPLPAAA